MPTGLSQACKTQGAIKPVMVINEKGTNTSGGKDLTGREMKVTVVCSSDIDSCEIEALLREGYEVVCVTTDVGQASGDSQYVKDYVYPCLGDGAIYERKYLLPVNIKGDIMWDPAYEAKKEMYMMLVDPKDAPCLPKYPAPVFIHGKVLVPAILLSDINDNGGTILADSCFDILRKSMDALMESIAETTGLSSENGQGNA